MLVIKNTGRDNSRIAPTVGKPQIFARRPIALAVPLLNDKEIGVHVIKPAIGAIHELPLPWVGFFGFAGGVPPGRAPVGIWLL